MSQRPKLKAEKREVIGKGVKRLRAVGKIPAHVYGRGIDSISLSVNQKEFQEIYRSVGQTKVLDLGLEETIHPVLVQGIQQDPVSNALWHIDFYKVNLKEKVRVVIPIVLIGDSPAVVSKEAVLEQPISGIEVEALPDDLPENIEVDVSGLAKIDDQILVSELQINREDVTVVTDAEAVVVKAGPLLTEEMQKALEEQKAAQEAQAAEATEGAEPAPTEGTAEEIPTQADKEPPTQDKPTTESA